MAEESWVNKYRSAGSQPSASQISGDESYLNDSSEQTPQSWVDKYRPASRTPEALESQRLIDQDQDPYAGDSPWDLSGQRDIFGALEYGLLTAPGQAFLGSFPTGLIGAVELADAAANAVGLDNLIDSKTNPFIKAAKDAEDWLYKESEWKVDPRYQDNWLTKGGSAIGSIASFFTPVGAVRGANWLNRARTGVEAAEGIGKLTRGEKIASSAFAASMGAGDQANRIEAARASGLDVSEGREDASIIGGGLVGLTEMIPIGRAFGRTNQAISRGRSAGIAFLEEGTQELGSGLLQDAIESGYNPNAKVLDGSLFDDFTFEKLADAESVQDFFIGGGAGAVVDFALNTIAGRRSIRMTGEQKTNEAKYRQNEEANYRLYRENMAAAQAAKSDPDALRELGVKTRQSASGIKPPEAEEVKYYNSQSPLGPVATPNAFGELYAYRILGSLGPHLPTNTAFGVTKEGDNYTVRDASGNQYGVTLANEQAAVSLARNLNKAVARADINQSILDSLSESTEPYSQQDAELLYRYGYRSLSPEANRVSATSLNDAAGTTAENGFEEDLPLELLATAKKLRDGRYAIQMPDGSTKYIAGLTASQELNLERTKQGLPPTNSFNINEVRQFLGGSIKGLSNPLINGTTDTAQYGGTVVNGKPVVVSSNGEVIPGRKTTQAEKTRAGKDEDGNDILPDYIEFQNLDDAKRYAGRLNQRTPMAKTMPAELIEGRDDLTDDIKRLLDAKNIASEVSSPEVNQLVKAFTGAETFGDMNLDDQKLFYARLRELPALTKKSKLPLFRKSEYTAEQFAVISQLENAKGSPLTPQEIADTLGVNVDSAAVKSLAEDLDKQNMKRYEDEVARETELEPVENMLKKVLKAFNVDPNLLVAQKSDVSEDGKKFFGFFEPRIQKLIVSINSIDPNGTLTDEQRANALKPILNHEVIHVLRYLDLFTAKEWAVLENAAARTKIPNKNVTYLQQARQLYAGQPVTIQVEEAIAEMAKDYITNKSVIGGKPRALLDRIIKFFKSLRNLMDGYGFQSFEDVLDAVASGKVGARKKGEVRSLRLTEEMTERQKGKLPERYLSFADQLSRSAPRITNTEDEKKRKAGRLTDFDREALKGADVRYMLRMEDLGLDGGRRYSVREISSLKDVNGNSLETFAQNFSNQIKQNTVTIEQANQIARDYIEEAVMSPASVIPFVSSDTIDYKKYLFMPDGTRYDPDKIEHADASMETVMMHFEQEKGEKEFKSYLREKAKEINQKRQDAISRLADYLNKNSDIPVTEKALIIRGATKYGVVFDQNRGLVATEITDKNDSSISVVTAAEAKFVSEELRKGKKLKTAIVDGAKKGIEERIEENKRRGYEGWKTFEKSSDMDDAATLKDAVAGREWCTGTSTDTAHSQLSNGDFHVYYEKGVPLVAVRTVNGRIAEAPRGSLRLQFMTPHERDVAEQFLLSGKVTGGTDYLRDRKIVRDVMSGEYKFWNDETLAMATKKRYSEGYGPFSTSWPPAVDTLITNEINDRHDFEEWEDLGYYFGDHSIDSIDDDNSIIYVRGSLTIDIFEDDLPERPVFYIGRVENYLKIKGNVDATADYARKVELSDGAELTIDKIINGDISKGSVLNVGTSFGSIYAYDTSKVNAFYVQEKLVAHEESIVSAGYVGEFVMAKNKSMATIGVTDTIFVNDNAKAVVLNADSMAVFTEQAMGFVGNTKSFRTQDEAVAIALTAEKALILGGSDAKVKTVVVNAQTIGNPRLYIEKLEGEINADYDVSRPNVKIGEATKQKYRAYMYDQRNLMAPELFKKEEWKREVALAEKMMDEGKKHLDIVTDYANLNDFEKFEVTGGRRYSLKSEGDRRQELNKMGFNDLYSTVKASGLNERDYLYFEIDEGDESGAFDIPALRKLVIDDIISQEQKTGGRRYSLQGETTRMPFEVAPSPANVQRAGRWNSMNNSEKIRITEQIGPKAVREAMRIFNINLEAVKRETLGQGLFEGTVNPNQVLELDPEYISPEQAVEFASALGQILEQKGMIVADGRMTGKEASVIRIYTDQDPKEVADRLYGVLTDKFGDLGGYTAFKGHIDIFNFTGTDSETLHNEFIDAINTSVPDIKVQVTHDTIQSAYIDEGEYDSNIGRSGQINRGVLEREIDGARSRIIQELESEIDRVLGPAPAASGTAGLRVPRGVRGGEGLLREPYRPYQEDGRTGQNLTGLLREVTVDGRPVVFESFKPAQELARQYMNRVGRPYNPPTTYVKVNPQVSKDIAEEFTKMKHDPKDPTVLAAYRQMMKETAEQFREILKTGLKIEFIRGEDPYGNPRNAILDIVENNHFWVFSTKDGFGSDQTFNVEDNPLLEETEFVISGEKALANDLFRVVHDYFGHVMNGVGFRADGEENAWRAHAAMYSPLARRAMTVETRGQNSWVNFGPNAEFNRTASPADTIYADQKVGLLPEWVSEDTYETGGRRYSRQPEGQPTEEQLKRAVEIAKKEDELAQNVIGPMLNPEASPEALYVAQNPTEGITLDAEGRRRYSRQNQPSYDPNAQAIIDKNTPQLPDESVFDSILRKLHLPQHREVADFIRKEAVSPIARLERQYRENPELKELLADTSAIAAYDMAQHARMFLQRALAYGVPVYQNGMTDIKDFIHNGKQIFGLVGVMNMLKTKQYGNLEALAHAYATAVRGERLNAEGKLTPVSPGELKVLEQEVNKFINPDTGKPIIKEWFDAYQDFNSYVIEYLKDTGVLDEAGAKLWLKQSDYVPFYREKENGELAFPQVFGGLHTARQFKAVGKSDKAINVDMITATFGNLDAAILMGMTNVAQQRIIRDQIKLGLARLIKPGEAVGDRNSVNFKVDGKKYTAIIDDPLIYESLLPINEIPLDGIIGSMFRIPANWLRNLIIRDPGYMFATAFRDTISTTVLTGAEIIPVVDTAKNVFADLTNLKNKGVVGLYDLKIDPDSVRKFYEKESKRQTMIGGINWKNPIMALWDGAESLSIRADAATRQAVYNDILARTGNEAEAQYQALQVMNYGRRGRNALLRVITSLVPFLNARIQGQDKIWQATTGRIGAKYEEDAQGNVTRNLNNMKNFQRFAGRSAALLGLTVLYYWAVHDDDEYKNASPEVRDNNYILPIMKGDTETGRPGLAMKLPIPFEVGILFKVIPERAIGLMRGEESYRDFEQSMKRQLYSTLGVSPPQAILPPLEALVMNKSLYTGRPVVPTYMQNLLPEQQKSFYTNQFAEDVANFFGWSPMKVEHIMEGYGGTLGSYLLQVLDSVYREGAERKPALAWYQYPVIKRFFTTANQPGLQNQFYDLKDYTDGITQTINKLYEQGRTDELATFYAKNGHVYEMRGDLNYMEKKITRLREQRKVIEELNIDPERKRKLIEQINMEIAAELTTVPMYRRQAFGPK